MKYDKDIVVKWFAEHGLDAVPEYRFDPHRKWRFDFVLMPAKLEGDLVGKVVALEVQGGLFIPGGGRHNRGAALLKEQEKLNAAACAGWRILYCIPDDLCTTDTVEMVKKALNI